jgi:hypothetical protein
VYKKSGFILPVTLILIALFVFSITYLTTKNMVFSSFSKTMVDREKARQLAYSGIQLAISQLMSALESEKKEAATATPAKQPAPAESNSKKFIKTMLPLFNTVQEFKLRKSTDGIDGAISFIIGSDDGKINLNSIYDFSQHKFVGEGQNQGDMKKIMQEFFAQLKDKTGNADLFAELEKFLKKRDYPLNDVTELLTIKAFEQFRDTIFYDPYEKKQILYLTDLFTLFSAPGIDPWLLSSSMQLALGLKKPTLNMDELLKLFKESITPDKDGPALFKTLYNADFAKISKLIGPLIRTQFDASFFWVISSGTVNKANVRFFAILEAEKKAEKNAAGYAIAIRKIYII